MDNSVFYCFHSWLDETKQQIKSIVIINSLFEIVINSLSEMVKASFFFCLSNGRSMNTRIFTLFLGFIRAKSNDCNR